MRIAVYGCGSVGGYFGGRLAQVGQDVTFIARNKSLLALQQQGLKVDSIAGDFSLKKVKASNSPAEVGEVDYLFCCVKAWQVGAAAKAMLPMIGEKTLVIPLQNGVEAAALLSEHISPDKVLGGLCAIIAFQPTPGHIKHIGANPLIRFGHRDKRADARINRLAEIFNRCTGVKCSIPDDINVALWQKFMLISPWSGLGAVSRAPIGILLKQAETRDLLGQAIEEIYQLGLAHNVELPEKSVDRVFELLQSFPPNSKTSMQRDLDAGAPSELDQQSGAVLRLGQAVGLATPVNQFFFYALRSLELRARGALKF